MASKFFIDTDVIIDFLIDRKPFAESSSQIFDLSEKGKIKIYTSAMCINNVHYIARKVMGNQKAKAIINDLLELIEVISASKKGLKEAVTSNITDFEDAIQHAVAVKEKGMRAIVTRNTKDYKHATISVFNPEALVKVIKNEG